MCESDSYDACEHRPSYVACDFDFLNDCGEPDLRLRRQRPMRGQGRRSAERARSFELGASCALRYPHATIRQHAQPAAATAGACARAVAAAGLSLSGGDLGPAVLAHHDVAALQVRLVLGCNDKAKQGEARRGEAE